MDSMDSDWLESLFGASSPSTAAEAQPLLDPSMEGSDLTALLTQSGALEVKTECCEKQTDDSLLFPPSADDAVFALSNNKRLLDSRWSQELLSMPIKDLNRYIKLNNLTDEEVASLKAARRRAKMRDYSKECKARRKERMQNTPDATVLYQQLQALQARFDSLLAVAQRRAITPAEAATLRGAEAATLRGDLQ